MFWVVCSLVCFRCVTSPPQKGKRQSGESGKGTSILSLAISLICRLVEVAVERGCLPLLLAPPPHPSTLVVFTIYQYLHW
eukprot:scaffold1540_cov194-Alexandrium_tamarense.AAC.4